MRAVVVFLEIILLIALSVGIALFTHQVRPDAVPLFKDWNSVREEQNVERGIRTVTASEALELWKSGSVLFVDARSAFSFVGGHIPGAVNCTPKKEQAQEPLSEVLPLLGGENGEESCGPTVSDSGEQFVPPPLPKDKPVLVYCDSLSCGLSDIVAEGLHQKGYEIMVMPEGIEGWMKAGGTIQGGAQ